MSHLVLARKYRPRSFTEVVGQTSIVNALTSALKKNRIAHAFLFTGSRGVGKTTIARILAKALVCKEIKDFDPCNFCHNCKSIDNFSSLDVIEIDGASHTSVDDIRDLRESARFKPACAKYKIFIIDEVHMLSMSAFNALLKILEEPPEHIIFIFATTESHKIPKTILSRCQRYDFKRVLPNIIFDNLKSIVQKEGFSFDDEALILIASLADGSLRDAQSLTEQVLTLEEKHYSLEKVAQALGVISHKLIKDLSLHLIKGEVLEGLKIIKDIFDNGLDMGDLMEGLCERFRKLSLCAHLSSFEEVKTIEPFIEEEDFLLSKSFEKNDLKRLFSISLDSTHLVFQAKNPYFALTLVVLDLALRPPLKEAYQIGQMLKRLENILQNRPQAKDIEDIKLNPKEEKEALYKEALEDPLVKKTLEIFGGNIANISPLKTHDII